MRPKTPTRKQLSEVFKNQDLLIRFEQLFEAAGSYGTILAIIEVTGDNALTNGIDALAQIEVLKTELEFLMQAIEIC